uniref:IE19 n=1 Tax=Human cytomegalovirus (strain Towne) TaxID=10363 RepID=Q91D82_HCMVT|nr:IE19 [Human herpesvirus 5 strain Towne]BAB68340.1 IE19 [Human herpesvirus 5 strain Towne]
MESSAKRKMDPDNPDEGPSSKVPRPETPVTKATTFLQTMLRKEVNSQLSLGDPLFPELAEESLKTFERVTEDCNENPEKDVLAELESPVPATIPLSSVIVAENSDQEESEQSDEEEEEGAQEEREDTVSVKSEPVSEIEEVAPEEEEDGAEEPTASGGKSTHPMVTRSKADQ